MRYWPSVWRYAGRGTDNCTAQNNHAHVIRLLALHTAPGKVDLNASDNMVSSPWMSIDVCVLQGTKARYLRYQA